jgi:DNA-binding winged helix-turn-helix (wHTH) protein
MLSRLEEDPVFSFGPFRLYVKQRLLLQGERPVRLGSRAFDVLIALVEGAGTLVTKDELMARIWPNAIVEPANLTVHVAALRRALGDGRGAIIFWSTSTAVAIVLSLPYVSLRHQRRPHFC